MNSKNSLLPRLLTVATLLAASLNVGVVHAQQEWFEVAATDERIWEVQGGSFEESRTKGGDPIAVVISRVTTKSTKQIDLRKSYVPIADCEKRMGKVVTLDLDGKFRFENDFLFGGGTVASSMAEFICEVYFIRVKAAEKKGI